MVVAPQHGDTGLVSALRMREQQNKELERQVKKYGEEEMAPALHAHDGMESSMTPGLGRVDRCIAWKAATGEKRGARPAKLTHAQFAAIRAPESSVQFKLRAPESSVQFKRKCPGANKAGLKF